MVISSLYDKDAFDEATASVSVNEPIYLIESPSAEDLYHGRNEGDALARTLSLGGIEVTYYLAINDELFDAAIDDIAIRINARPDHNSVMPFIHISAHGDEDGFHLTDGDMIFWDKLTRKLHYLSDLVEWMELPDPFPSKLSRLNLALSSCSAYKNYKAALSSDSPFQMMLRPNDDIGWCQALIGFTTFYYQSFVKRASFQVAMRAMNAASSSPEGPIFERYIEFDLEGIATKQVIDKFPPSSKSRSA